MPAVTVDNILTLPRVTEPVAEAVSRPVRSVTTAPERASRARASRCAAPSPASTSPRSTRSSTWTRWVRSSTPRVSPRAPPWHPHRGFETVTYIIDGTFEHQDSNGGGGMITNGDTQWMTAGAGILHIETPPEELVISGGLFHGIQLWVNLPAAMKMVAPALPGHPRRRRRAAVHPRRRRAGARHRRRRRRPPRARHHPHADHRRCTPRSPPARGSGCRGTPTSTPWSTCSPAQGTVGAERRPIRQGQLAVLGAGDVIEVGADESQESRSPSLDVSSSAGGRSASRSRRTARSS